MSRNALTRREFLGATLMGAGALACGAHQSPRLLAEPPGDPRLRLVFFTDIHARTEWETPQAMARAAKAINACKPDLVIAGGDLITDGFQSSAGDQQQTGCQHPYKQGLFHISPHSLTFCIITLLNKYIDGIIYGIMI
jgi:hypothetical protein